MVARVVTGSEVIAAAVEATTQKQPHSIAVAIATTAAITTTSATTAAAAAAASTARESSNLEEEKRVAEGGVGEEDRDPKRRKVEGEDTTRGGGESKGLSLDLNSTPSGIMAGGGEMMEVEIDEDLHSRQLAVYGRESMRRLAACSVLISGLGGLGVEIAKNVILAGVKAVTLHDTERASIRDLASQFYLREADVTEGKNKAEACVGRLQELNAGVSVSAHVGNLSEEVLAAHQVVVLTQSTWEEAVKVNEFCRSQSPPIAFIRSSIHGVFASAFSDFGKSFTVVDSTGEEPNSGMVTSISSSNPALVTCVDDERLGFDEGDYVVFQEVQGMTTLNDGKPRRVRNVKAHSFELEEDTTGMGDYSRGGIVTQFKMPKSLDFKSLVEATAQPGEFLLSDFSKFDRPPLLHIAFRALDEFRAKNGGRLPAPGSVEDADALVSLAKESAGSTIQDQTVEVDEKIVRYVAAGATAQISPMAAALGGIVGQEVVKAATGKFHPIFQFFYFDAVECLPSDPLPPEETLPAGGRYDDQIILFGRTFQAKLQDLRVFMVGAGALGCEFLKNLALMGVACPLAGKPGDWETGGLLTATDDDVIERSNLSRQFLFRDKNIGQAKSAVAAAAAEAINPAFRVRALQNRVSPETEAVFNDSFWESTDVVVNALDNVSARLYVDSRCVYFNKPLLESGTLGPKCNTQMVIPKMTENYGASRDPPEKQAPMCTLHSFPHNIDHCLTWARSEFEGFFEKIPSEVNNYLSKPADYAAAARKAADAQMRDTLERVVGLVVTERCRTYEDCLTWARLRFEDFFVNKIKQLTYNFPEDAATSTGALFWSAPKRFPRPVTFSTSDPTHLSLIIAAANLRAEVFGIPLPPWLKDTAAVAKAVEAIPVPEFVPKEGVKIVTDEKATSVATEYDDDEALIERLLKQLEETTAGGLDVEGGKLTAISFEKDDDTNFHMDFIAGFANMRARNYSIEEVDKLKAKFIAGRIIPAIATTTALATGLVCLEFYKVVQNKPLEAIRNTFANLAVPLFAMAEPVAPKAVKFTDMEWSVWDRWILEGDITLQELLDWFTAKKLTAYSISCGQSLVYSSLFPKHVDRLGKKVSELAIQVAKLDIPEYRRHFDLVVACEDEEGEDLDVPLVSIRFR